MAHGKSILLVFLYLALIHFALQISAANAAPIPGTSSSAIVGSDFGLYRSEMGFSIHAGNTAWEHTNPPAGSPYIATMYKAPSTFKGIQAAMTVRVDSLKKKTSLAQYVKNWRKDFSRFGFDVLAARKVKVTGKKGFMLDLLNKDTNKQLRQVIFVREKKAVILTCRDHHENFNRTLPDCNNLVRNFSWN